MQDEIHLEQYEQKMKALNELNKVVSIRTLIDDLDTLKHMLLKETELLQQRKFKPVREQYDDKQKLIRSLEIRKKVIKHDPSVIVDASPEVLQELKDTQASLQEALEENQEAVLMAREANRIVVKAIADAVNKEVQKEQASYNSSATTNPTDVGRNMEMPSISVNESA